jgi:hypothetical protein
LSTKGITVSGVQIKISVKGGRRIAAAASSTVTTAAVSAVSITSDVPEAITVQLAVVTFLGSALTWALSKPAERKRV